MYQQVEYTAQNVRRQFEMPSVESKLRYLNKYLVRDGPSGEPMFMICDTKGAIACMLCGFQIPSLV